MPLDATHTLRSRVTLAEGVRVREEDPKDVFLKIVSGLPLHNALAGHLRQFGFLILQVIRYDHHPVWLVRMRRGGVAHGTEMACVRHQVKAFLGGYGVKCRLKDVDVVVAGDRVDASFLWERGAPGVVSFYGDTKAILLGYPY